MIVSYNRLTIEVKYMKKHLRRKIGDQIRSILLVTILTVGSVALLTVTVLMLFFNSQRYQSESEKFAYISRELHRSLEDAEAIVRVMAYDTYLTDQLLELRVLREDSEKGKEALEAVRQSVANYCNGDHYISYVNLWQNQSIAGCRDEKIVRFSRYAPVSEMLNQAQRDQLTQYAMENSGLGCWAFLEGDDEGVYYVRLVRTIKEFKFVNLGVVAVRVNLQRLINDLAVSDEKYGNQIIMLGKGDRLVLTSSGNLQQLDRIYAQMLDREKEYQILRMENHWYFIIETLIPPLNMRCCYMVIYDQLYIIAVWGYVICILGLLLVLMAALVISGRMIRQITRHFDTLSYKMNVYSRGNLEPLDVGFDYTGGTDELSQAHVHLDNMATQIRSLIEDNYIKQLRIQEAAFKALEQQINPHFLYNTLSSIQWQAVAAGQTEISQMVCSLGNIMRFSLNSADVVCVKDELAVVRDYMTIQKLRYQERLEWNIWAEEKSFQLLIPKMTIQPLVENAIKYGLEQMTDDICIIDINVREEVDRFIVKVRNNGSAFEENFLEKLRSGLISPNGFGIGLLNIDERIQLLCGQQYGLRVYNEEGCAVVCAVLSKHIQSSAGEA